MKIVLIAFFFISSATFADSDFLPTGNFKFIEFKKYELQETFPPQILLTFDLPCNYDFVKVVRVEKVDSKSKETMISLGGVAKENLLSSCAGKVKEFNISAGNTYSGKQYKITKIKK